MKGTVIRTIRPTRIELLKLKKQEQIARKGHTLLSDKLDALILEFVRHMEVYRKEKHLVEEQLGVASGRLSDAMLCMGNRRIEEIARSTPEIRDIPMSSRIIMGVKVPLIEPDASVIRNPLPAYSSLGTTALLDEAVSAYQDLSVALLRLAGLEGTVRMLAREVKTTRRRVNALEHILLPRLAATRHAIEMHLEEREREDIFRRKRTKQLLMEH